MTIIAQSADGVQHEFPDGTNPAVIDKVMKDYAAQASKSAAPGKSADGIVPYGSGAGVGGLLQNFPTDAYNTVKGIGEGIYAGGRKLVTDPVGAARDVYDAANTAGVTAVGGIENAYNMAAPQNMQIERRPEMEMASQVGAGLKDKYWDNLGKTLYEHPFQSAMDISSLAYGGEGLATKLLGEGAMATRVLGKTAELTNPLNVVAKPIQAVRNASARGSALKEMRANAPTYDQVGAAKNARYDALDNAGIKFDANAYGQMMQSIAGKLRTFREKRAPLTRDLAEKNMMSFYGKSPSFRDVEEMLIEAKGILREPGALESDKAAAGIILDEVNSFFNNAPLMTNGSIPADQVAALAKDARELARRHILARQVGEMERKSKWYLSGDESGIRNQFSSFGKREGKSLTPLEEKAAKAVVRREGIHGLLGSGGSKLTQVGLLVAGLPTAGIFPTAIAGGLSLGARAASAAMTNRKLDQFMKTVLAGKDAQKAALLNAKRLPLKTKGLLLGAEGVGLLGGHRAP